MMTHSLRHLRTTFCLVTLCSLATVAAAGAQGTVTLGWKKIGAPVRVPGATLSPGTYIFERVGGAAERQFIRIRQMKGGRQVALVMTTTAGPRAVGTAGRPDAHVPEVMFRNMPGAQVPIVSVLYFGDEGFQLLYAAQEERAMRSAASALARK